MIQVTGNEYISLPKINEMDGSISYLTVLNMQMKGLLQLEGNPFIKPSIKVDNRIIDLKGKLRWERKKYWIPIFVFENDEIKLVVEYLCPSNQKAFVINFKVINKTNKKINIDCDCLLDFAKTLQVVNESIDLDIKIKKKKSDWNHGIVHIQSGEFLLIALAKMESNNQFILDPKKENESSFFFGIGYEEVSACTNAKHLKRIGYSQLIKEEIEYLDGKIFKIDNKKNEEILNNNLLFCYYFSTGLTYDSEEFVLVTSRSPRYYVSAAYWDRDSLLWSFPSLLLFDNSLGRKVFDYVFKKQIKNIGEHSRFIDGTLLEPGFELDELCSPVIALNRYIEKTKDIGILELSYIQEGLQRINQKLKTKRHKEIALYETFLMPTDDFTKQKYLTYNNVLVFKTLKILSTYLQDRSLLKEAERVKDAIYKYCVKSDMFVWSTDLEGSFSIYDEPPGSLQLLNYYGFCDKDDKIWCNTVSHIRSEKYSLSFKQSKIAEIGCDHAPHPWLLSLCNSILANHGESALKHLSYMEMDNKIACESVFEDTGKCSSGEAFATCAGFLSYCLYWYYFK